MIPKEILNNLKAQSRENTPMAKNGMARLCRTLECIDGDWTQCPKRGLNECEGHCKLHHKIFDDLDKDNDKEWKLPVTETQTD